LDYLSAAIVFLMIFFDQKVSLKCFCST